MNAVEHNLRKVLASLNLCLILNNLRSTFINTKKGEKFTFLKHGPSVYSLERESMSPQKYQQRQVLISCGVPISK